MKSLVRLVVLHTLLYTVGLSPPEVEIIKQPAQLLGLCVCLIFDCPALDGDDIEQVVYSHKILKRD